jgi:hypothetical protein
VKDCEILTEMVDLIREGTFCSAEEIATLRKYAAIARAVEAGRCLIVSPGVAKLPDLWRGITTNRDIERDARVWMEGYDAALVYCAEALHKALAAAPQLQEE